MVWLVFVQFLFKSDVWCGLSLVGRGGKSEGNMDPYRRLRFKILSKLITTESSVVSVVDLRGCTRVNTGTRTRTY